MRLNLQLLNFIPGRWIRLRSRRNSQRGQGTLEFVLLIIVFIALVLGLTAQFFKPFKKYADYYLGDYISCLLDEGELPVLGNEDSTIDCGTPPTSFADASATAGKKNSDANAAANGANANSKKNGQNGKGGAGGGGGGDLVSRDGKSFRSKRGSGADGGGAGGENSTKADGSAGKGPKYLRALGSGGETIIIHRPSRELDYGSLSSAAKQQAEQSRSSSSITIEAPASGNGQSPKRLELKPSVRSTGSIDMENEPWSFGKIFRIVLIVLVLIALTLVIGGQLNSIRKGSEK